jgi:hypothetical protein
VAKIDGGKRREPERLPNLYVSGSVLVRLSGGKGDGNLDEPYRLAVTSRPAAAGAEREPNGSAALATPLAAGAEGSGLIYPRGDVDYWRVQVAPAGPGGSLAVSVRGIPDVVLDVRVHGASGQGRELARFRAGGDAPAPPRVTPGADGCCVVQIKDPSGRAANPRDRYTLSVAP